MLNTILLCLMGMAPAAVPAPAAPPAVPDVIPRGFHSVPVDRKVDIQAFRKHCCVQYVIQKGDTFAKIASKHLGKASRSKEIARLNPKLDPRRLRIGERIWLPPLDTTAPYDFLHLNTWPRAHHGATPYAIGDKVTGRYGEFAFLVVGAAHRTELAKVKTWDQVVAMKNDRKLQIVMGRSTRGIVKDGSGIERITEAIKAECDSAGRYSVKVDVENLDGKGKPIVADKGNEKDRDQAWLLLVALGGAGLVLWRRRQRTRNPVRIAVA